VPGAVVGAARWGRGDTEVTANWRIGWPKYWPAASPVEAQWKPSVPVLGDHSVRSADALQRYALPSVDYVPERRTSSSPA